jgi:hypothetical protein
MLEALAAGDRQGSSPRGAGYEVLDERCLARARLAGHEDQLALARERAREPLVEKLDLAAAADESHGGLGGRRPSRRPDEERPRGSPVALARLRSGDVGDEPIAAPVNGLDEPRLGAESPRALRISETQTFSTPSATWVSGQTSFSNWSFETSWPRRSISTRKTSNALGLSGIGPEASSSR